MRIGDTKSVNLNFNRLRQRLHFDHHAFINAVGLSGGIVMFMEGRMSSQ